MISIRSTGFLKQIIRYIVNTFRSSYFEIFLVTQEKPTKNWEKHGKIYSTTILDKIDLVIFVVIKKILIVEI